MPADQIEARRRRAPREGAIVQAEQTDHAERQAAHRHHAAKGNPATQKSGFVLAVEIVADVADNSFAGYRVVESSQIGFGLPA